MTQNLEYLIPQELNSSSDLFRWATVTQVSPLRIKLDGDSAALLITPDSTVSGLSLNDRVYVALPSNDNPAFRGRRLTVIGRSGGLIIPNDTITNAMMTNNSVNTAELVDQSVTSAKLSSSAFHNANGINYFPNPTVSTTSGTYVDVTGASVAITKRLAATKIRVAATLGFYNTVGDTGVAFAARIGSTDYFLGNNPAATDPNSHKQFHGFTYIAGLAAGTVTAQLRFRRIHGTGIIHITAGGEAVGDWVALEISEVVP